MCNTQRMGTLIELGRRYLTFVKLGRGQCLSCFKPLRDDATSRYCSDECDFQHMAEGY